MKSSVRTFIYRIEDALGSCVGFLSRSFSWEHLYKKAVSWNRQGNDRQSLRLAPFFTAWGRALYDLRTPFFETLTLINGPILTLNLSEKTQRQIFSHKLFEAGLSRFVLRNLEFGDTFVDVGANVGYFSILAGAVVGTNGTVVALEPERGNFEALERNIQQNFFSQVHAFKCAAADTDGGTMTLNVNPLNRGGNSMIPFDAYASEGTLMSTVTANALFAQEDLFQEVPLRTLDRLLLEGNILRVKILKIDVEGFELNVLEGSRVLLSKQIPQHVVCEVNNNQTRQEVFTLFKEYGYVPNRIMFDGTPVPLESTSLEIRGNVLFSCI